MRLTPLIAEDRERVAARQARAPRATSKAPVATSTRGTTQIHMGPVSSSHHGGVSPAPIGFAHRGASAECRDNTLASFSRARQLGAQALESDIWLTGDGVVVMDHDGLVRRGLRREPIGGLRQAELPTHIPTLAALYQELGSDFDLSLDVKGTDPERVMGCGNAAIEVAAAHGAAARMWLCTADDRQEARWARSGTGVRSVDSTRLARIEASFGSYLEHKAALGVAAINLHRSDWDPARVEAAHRAGLAAWAWDCQSQTHLAAALDLGVDAVFSDHVGRMLKAIAQSRPSEQ